MHNVNMKLSLRLTMSFGFRMTLEVVPATLCTLTYLLSYTVITRFVKFLLCTLVDANLTKISI